MITDALKDRSATPQRRLLAVTSAIIAMMTVSVLTGCTQPSSTSAEKGEAPDRAQVSDPSPQPNTPTPSPSAQPSVPAETSEDEMVTKAKGWEQIARLSLADNTLYASVLDDGNLLHVAYHKERATAVVTLYDLQGKLVRNLGEHRSTGRVHQDDFATLYIEAVPRNEGNVVTTINLRTYATWVGELQMNVSIPEHPGNATYCHQYDNVCARLSTGKVRVFERTLGGTLHELDASPIAEGYVRLSRSGEYIFASSLRHPFKARVWRRTG
jgi:hypothetical protein